MAAQWGMAIRLAWKDWHYETLLSLCAVIALASMLAPLLILQGLKNGVTEGMRENLLKDPATLVITPKSDDGRYPPAFIDALGKYPGVAYAIGRTRATAADLTFYNGSYHASLALEPSTPGEPLLAKYKIAVPRDGSLPQIVLSAAGAASLQAERGTHLTASLSRRNPAGKLESLPLSLEVAGILPVAAGDRKMAFIPLALMEDMENFRDNIDVPARSWPGVHSAAPRIYASFRIYAQNLDDVPALARKLASQNIEALTRSRDIAAIKSLEAAINQIILIIGMAVGAGFGAFMLSSAEGSARRKKKMIGMLRLLGFRRLPLLLYPLTQSFLTATSGYMLSLLLYWSVAEAIAHTFTEKGGLQCHLGPVECLWTFAAAIILSGLASFHAAWSTSALEPSMVIRETS